MNLNELQDIGKILEEAQNFITENISNLPEEEQVKLREMETWAKTASLEELKQKLIEVQTEKPK